MAFLPANNAYVRFFSVAERISQFEPLINDIIITRKISRKFRGF
jgi:hypothetical protein